MRRYPPLALLLLASACVAPPATDNAGELTEDVKPTAFPVGGYFQIDSGHPRKGQITLIMFSTATAFWGERCADDHCDPATGISGTYKHQGSTLHLYDPNGGSYGTWTWSMKGSTLWLRGAGYHTSYPLDPMSEDLCDSGGGSWTDDDLGEHGFNCVCPDGGNWSATGCQACTSSCPPPLQCTPPLAACAGLCVDLASDPTNCGACGAGCSKAQHCVNGACQ